MKLLLSSKRMHLLCMVALGNVPVLFVQPALSAPEKRYYAYPPVEDRHGVIAPWYKGLNGQCDFRVRIAAETLKRYPWADSGKAPFPAPGYMYNGHWRITPDGTIQIPPLSDWDNGDLGQRAAFIFSGLLDYYRYSGDPAAIAHITILADLVLELWQTGSDHRWPNFFISCPTRGAPYGKCHPDGFIQLDIAAQVGRGLIGAYQLTEEPRYLETAKHWADLLAENRNPDPGVSPWNRYANPEAVWWNDTQTGGVVLILQFLEDLIRLGYSGRDGSLLEARKAGRAYLRDRLLQNWTAQDSFARHYWDWEHPFQGEMTTEAAAQYLVEHRDAFPDWRTDARNILGLFIHRACAATASNGGIFSGAWAYPEGPGCCGRSLWYAPLQISWALARYGAVAGSEWAREMARRQVILNTYDCHETGVVEDNIDGGQIVAGNWFKIAHPMALRHVLGCMAWLPEVLGASRENHILRSSSVVTRVVYGKGRIAYTTFDAPEETVDLLRLAFRPSRVACDGKQLPEKSNLPSNGYTAKALSNGDWIVTVRHDGARRVTVEGEDPQEVAGEGELKFTGEWRLRKQEKDFGGSSRVASAAGATMTFSFQGNQVRLIGPVGPRGGRADVLVDGKKQLAGIDCWNPISLERQVLYYRSGLENGHHTLEIAVRGERNPLSEGTDVWVDGVQFSSASGAAGFGEGGGPTGPQRWILGYPHRRDHADSKGNLWQPATEVVIRTGNMTDAPNSWYRKPRRRAVSNTGDPALYRHGMHGREFTAHFTVGPGNYHVRLRLMETRAVAPELRALDIAINGKQVASGMDIAATAMGLELKTWKSLDKNRQAREGLNTAADLVFNGVEPARGVITVRFSGARDAEAIASALEVGPGHGGEGLRPISLLELR